MLTGARCLDGSAIVSLVEGSTWLSKNGIWTLIGCPAGYFLSSEQCLRCSASFYCAGGNEPSEPCDAGLFTLPGATAKTSCFPSEYVIISINLPIKRPDFSDAVSLQFQSALAQSVKQDPGYIMIDTIKSGGSLTTTIVISKIAVLNASAADVLVKNLD